MGEEEDTGRPVLRIAGPDNAIALMKLKQCLDEETSFMLLEPGERDTSTQALARHLEEVSRSENSIVIVAGRRGNLAGYAELVGGKFRRNRATTHLPSPYPLTGGNEASCAGECLHCELDIMDQHAEIPANTEPTTVSADPKNPRFSTR